SRQEHTRHLHPFPTRRSSDLLSPIAPKGDWSGTLIDYNVRAERMGWLPSAPQLETNPIELGRRVHESGDQAADVVVGGLRSGELDRKSTRLNSSHVKISYAVF